MDILDKFIENAKASVDEGYYRNIQKAEVKHISLRKKIESQNFTLITEIKHASPAGEYEFKNIDVEKTAGSFAKCGSDAISVVVEPKIFKGNISNIKIAKRAELPVLFKDFVFTFEQIEAARDAGADCILLVVKVTERLGVDLDKLIDKAHEEGLEVLLESYDELEMKRALSSKADILGINNRQLTTLKVDTNRTKEIMSAVGEIDRPLISESGIKTAQDIKFIMDSGAQGALVGTAIWKADDLESKIRELKGAGL
ncbi:MAG: indole-3-glycerol-phosphate synthase [Candidatus Micrarchaeota archaeon]